MAESLTGGIARAYLHPRAAMARQVADGLSEGRALFHLLLACGLFWVARLPEALRSTSAAGTEDPGTAAAAASLFGLGVLAPLGFYGLAALLNLGARAFGTRTSFLAARAALFWSLLLGAPLALAVSALAVALAERLVVPTWLGYGALAYWFWLLAASIAEVYGVRRTGSIAAGLGLSFAVVAACVTIWLPTVPGP